MLVGCRRRLLEHHTCNNTDVRGGKFECQKKVSSRAVVMESVRVMLMGLHKAARVADHS